MISALFYIFIEPLINAFQVLIYILKPILEINPIMALLSFSFIVNFVSHPIFKTADLIALNNREKYAQLLPKIQSIKKNFSGFERRMLLATYLKENHYFPPVAALKQSLVIFLQVPFFVAAYIVVGNYDFLFMPSIGDNFAVFDFWGFSIRILPIVMTLINFMSLHFYGQRTTNTEKVYAVSLPLIFLFLLYNSKAAIVLYWIFNNCFSLLRNVLLHNPSKIKPYALSVFCAVLSFALYMTDIKSTLYACAVITLIFTFWGVTRYFWRKNYAMCGGVILYLCSIVIGMQFVTWVDDITIYAYTIFLVVLAITMARWISTQNIEISLKTQFLPLVVLFLLFFSTSFQAVMSDILDFDHVADMKQVLFWTFCTDLGVCIVYPLFIFQLFKKERKNIYFALSSLLFVFLLNFVLFSGRFGPFSLYMISLVPLNLNYEPFFNVTNLLLSCLVIWAVACVIYKNLIKYMNLFLLSMILVLLFQIGICYHSVFPRAKLYESNETFSVQLNPNKNNVVVFFLDMAMAGFFAEAMDEMPEIKENFDGFIYYPNSVSFGPRTLYSSPSLLGGYEYTPKVLQENKKQTMHDKHNEAIQVLPELFRKQGYNVILNDMPYINYGSFKEQNPFHKDIHSYNLKSKYQLRNTKDGIYIRENLFWFDLFMFVPSFLKESTYNQGSYLRLSSLEESYTSLWVEYQVFKDFILRTSTDTMASDTFVLFHSLIPHEPHLLTDTYDIPTKEERQNHNMTKTNTAVQRYRDVNRLTYKMLSEYFDKLKSLGVYDNTRIILISDHGWFVDDVPSVDKKWVANNILLAVKDFGAKGPVLVNHQFMTAADLPYLAVQDIIFDPKNPFTGKEITENRKEEGVDIINNMVRKWDPTQFKDLNHTYFYEEDDAHFEHIGKEGILEERIQ